MDCAVVTDKAGNDINNHNGTTLRMLTSNVSLRAAQRPDLETKGIMLVQVLKSFSYKHPVQDNARCLLPYGINIRLKRVLSFFPFSFPYAIREKKINAVLFYFTYTVLKSVRNIIFFFFKTAPWSL